jgi:hypothetical protein
MGDSEGKVTVQSMAVNELTEVTQFVTWLLLLSVGVIFMGFSASLDTV